jgi:acetolactate synthase regulatory subunit
MQLTFVIAAENRADVLPRLVMVFHRSAVDIKAIHMPLRKKRASQIKLRITVDGNHRNAERMVSLLEQVVEVLSVETMSRK